MFGFSIALVRRRGNIMLYKKKKPARAVAHLRAS